MQVVSQKAWINRSLIYLSRLYNHLDVGEDYDHALKSIHIAIIDFQLFEHETVFYSQNLLMDKNTHRIYSDNLCLNVLSLKHIENATASERKNGLYQWAKLFAAKTWEELKMIAKNNDILQEAEETMKDLSHNWAVQLQCEMREYDRKMHQLEVRDAFNEGIAEGTRQEHERMKEVQAKLEQEKRQALDENHQLQEKNRQVLEQNQQKDMEIQKLKEQLKSFISSGNEIHNVLLLCQKTCAARHTQRQTA